MVFIPLYTLGNPCLNRCFSPKQLLIKPLLIMGRALVYMPNILNTFVKNAKARNLIFKVSFSKTLISIIFFLSKHFLGAYCMLGPKIDS